MRLFENPYRSVFLILMYLGLTLFLVPAFGQDINSYSEKSLNEKEIKDLVDLTKYDKTVKRLKAKKRSESLDGENLKKTQEEDEEEINIPQSNMSFSFGPIFSGLLYLLIAALVIFILFMIFSSIKVDKKIKNEVIPKKDEIDDIEIIDAESGLELALKAENYREALRMLFIKLLQVLVQEKSIEWKPEKTNRNYLREMSSHQKIQHFNNLVIAYERIWYGSEPIDKLFFNFLRTDFEKFYSTENVNIDVKE